MPGERSARRALRAVLAGLALYGLLLWPWLGAGLDAHYDQLVHRAALGGLWLLTHFPLGASTLPALEVHNQGFALVLLAALAPLAAGWPWLPRLARFGALGLVAFAAHAGGLALQLHLALALEFQRRVGAALLLPWEIELARRAAQMLFVVGLAAVPFVGLTLTVWSHLPLAGMRRPTDVRGPSRPGRRTLVGLGLAAALGFGGWYVRERDARHVAAHVLVGNLLWRHDRPAEARRQYAAALRWGRRGQAAVEAGLAGVPDPVWRLRLRQALSGAGR